MSTPENAPISGGRPTTFDSLNVDLIIVEGNEDTTVRPCPPSLRAAHAEYRRLLAEWKKRSSETPPEPPPPDTK
jgi:hypothetical protein